MNGTPIRVLVVDAEGQTCERLTDALEGEQDIVVSAAAGDEQEALALADEVEPDVVVMGLGLPQLDGVQATRILTSRESSPAVLALASAPTEALALDAIRAGAVGVCARDDMDGGIVDAIRGVASGYAIVDPVMLRDLSDRVPLAEAPLEECTPREREVMALVARGATNPEVCEELVITDATVRTHIRSLRRKLGARTRAELVSRALIGARSP